MAWRRPGDKPLSEPMMIILLTHICVTLVCAPLQYSDVIHREQFETITIMLNIIDFENVCCPAISRINADISQNGPRRTDSSDISIKIKIFSLRKMHSKCRLRATRHYMNQWWPVNWRRLESLDYNELTMLPLWFGIVFGYFWIVWEMILDMGSVNERRRSIITSSLIGCAHNQILVQLRGN